MNPLKSDYDTVDIAGEYLGSTIPRWMDQFGKSDFAAVYRNQKRDCISYLAKEIYTIYKAKPILENALRQSGMENCFGNWKCPAEHMCFLIWNGKVFLSNQKNSKRMERL